MQQKARQGAFAVVNRILKSNSDVSFVASYGHLFFTERFSGNDSDIVIVQDVDLLDIKVVTLDLLFSHTYFLRHTSIPFEGFVLLKGRFRLLVELIIIDDSKARMRKTFDNLDDLRVRFFGPSGFGEECCMIPTIRLRWN